MARFLPNTLAAFAAVLIVAVSMNAVVSVPPAHAYAPSLAQSPFVELA